MYAKGRKTNIGVKGEDGTKDKEYEDEMRIAMKK